VQGRFLLVQNRAVSSLRLWPIVDPHQCLAHQRSAIALRQTMGDAKGVNALLVGQHSDCAGPVGAPHATVEAKSVEDPAERIPDISVRIGLVCQRAGAAYLDGNIIMGGERQQLRQIGERLGRRWWLVWLRQAKMVNHQPRIRVTSCQLASLVEASRAGYVLCEGLGLLVLVRPDAEWPADVVEDDRGLRIGSGEVGQLGDLGMVQPGLKGEAERCQP